MDLDFNLSGTGLRYQSRGDDMVLNQALRRFNCNCASCVARLPVWVWANNIWKAKVDDNMLIAEYISILHFK